MGWERGYYYRPRKVKGRVIKEYIGPGFVGQLAARLDVFRREDEELRRVMKRIESEDGPHRFAKQLVAEFARIRVFRRLARILANSATRHPGVSP